MIFNLTIKDTKVTVDLCSSLYIKWSVDPEEFIPFILYNYENGNVNVTHIFEKKDPKKRYYSLLKNNIDKDTYFKYRNTVIKYDLPLEEFNTLIIQNMIKSCYNPDADYSYLSSCKLCDINLAYVSNGEMLKKIFNKFVTFNSTEEEAVNIILLTFKHTSNFKKYFPDIFKKFPNIFKCIKSKSNQKKVSEKIFKSGNIDLITEITQEYKLKSSEVIEKGIKNKDSAIILGSYSQLTLSKKEEYWPQIIRILPIMLFDKEFPIELITELEKVQNIEWELFGPDPGVKTDYCCSKSLFKKINCNTSIDIIKLILEKTNPKINKIWFRSFLKNTTKFNEDFFEIIDVLKDKMIEIERKESEVKGEEF